MSDAARAEVVVQNAKDVVYKNVGDAARNYPKWAVYLDGELIGHAWKRRGGWWSYDGANAHGSWSGTRKEATDLLLGDSK